jgi:hypothetical protein
MKQVGKSRCSLLERMSSWGIFSQIVEQGEIPGVVHQDWALHFDRLKLQELGGEC